MDVSSNWDRAILGGRKLESEHLVYHNRKSVKKWLKLVHQAIAGQTGFRKCTFVSDSWGERNCRLSSSFSNILEHNVHVFLWKIINN